MRKDNIKRGNLRNQRGIRKMMFYLKQKLSMKLLKRKVVHSKRNPSQKQLKIIHSRESITVMIKGMTSKPPQSLQ
jgi:hypothetical protein